MKSQLVVVFAVLWVTQTLEPQKAFAARLPDLAGTFRLVAEQSDDVSRAIERAIAPMSFFVRPFARSRLRQINAPYQRLTIEPAADTVVIVADPRVTIRTPLNGAPISWKREDGEPFNVSGTWDGAAFEQSFVSGSGRRVNRYSVDAGGQILRIDVVVTGGGLPGALTYRLVYQRVS